MVVASTPARADTSYCGFEIDTINPADDPFGAFDQETRAFYDRYVISELHSTLGGDQATFCKAAWYLIESGAKSVVVSSLGGVVAGRGLSFMEKQAFKQAYDQVANQGSTPASIPAVGPSGIQGTVQDTYYGGTWAYTDPNAAGWSAGWQQPANAHSWLDNGQAVTAVCQRASSRYRVHLDDGTVQVWDKWAALDSGAWVRTAVIAIGSGNGDMGLPPC